MLRGAYCSECGQRAFRSRFTVTGIARDALAEFLSVDRGVLHTFLGLSTRPGHFVRGYISGRTARLTNPAKYMFIAYAAAGVTIFGVMWRGASGDIPTYMKVVVALPILIMLIHVPLSALYTSALFRTSRATFAEHLILHTYLFAHLTLVCAVIAALMLVFGTVHIAVIVVLQALLAAYLASATAQFFQAGPTNGFARGLAAAFLAAGTLAAILFLVQRFLS